MIYVILPVHNRIIVTKDCILSLKKQTEKNFHVVLVDDGCTDRTVEMVIGELGRDKVTVLSGKGDWWWGGSLQQGYLYLKGLTFNNSDKLLILNDDTTFSSDFLRSGNSVLETMHKGVLLLAQDYDESDNKVLLDQGTYLDWIDLSFRPVSENQVPNVLSTRGLMLWMEDFINLRGFHPRLIPHYLSDYEFTHRAFQKGYQLKTDRRFKLYEKTGETGIRSVEVHSLKSFLRKYWNKRSVYYHPAWIWFVILRCPSKSLKLKHIWKMSMLRKGLYFFRQQLSKLFRTM